MCTIIHIILSYDAFVTFHYVFDPSYGIVDPSNTLTHAFYIYIVLNKFYQRLIEHFSRN